MDKMAGLINFILLLCSASQLTSFTSVDEMNSLNEDILKNYKKNIRPPYDNDQTLAVSTVVYLMSVLEYDGVSGILRVIGGATMSWYDYRLSWNTTDYANITELVIARDVLWFPDAIITNPAEEVKPLAFVDRVLVRVYSDGRIVYTFVDKFSVICESDMTYFPFDTQTCSIMISPWLYTRKEVQFVKRVSDVNLDFYRNSSVWDMLSAKVEESVFGIYGGIDIQITLKRRPLYFCINMLLPVLVLAIMNPLVFVLPPDSGERISFSVTIFLSFAVFITMIGDHLPKSSSTMARTSYFLLAVISYSAVINIIAIINLWICKRKTSTRNSVEKGHKDNMICGSHQNCQNGQEFQAIKKSKTGCCRDIGSVIDCSALIISYVFLISIVAAFSLIVT